MNHISSFYFKPIFGIIYAIDIISFISLDEACQFYRSVNLSKMGRGRNVIVFSSNLKTNICLKIFGEKHSSCPDCGVFLQNGTYFCPSHQAACSNSVSCNKYFIDVQNMSNYLCSHYIVLGDTCIGST